MMQSLGTRAPHSRTVWRRDFLHAAARTVNDDVFAILETSSVIDTLQRGKASSRNQQPACSKSSGFGMYETLSEEVATYSA